MLMPIASRSVSPFSIWGRARAAIRKVRAAYRSAMRNWPREKRDLRETASSSLPEEYCTAATAPNRPRSQAQSGRSPRRISHQADPKRSV